MTVKGRKAVLTDSPDTIAGSVTNLYDCMRNCVHDMGIPLEQAIQAATENPARSIGIEKDYGRMAPGNYASFLLVDEKLQIRSIINYGKEYLART